MLLSLSALGSECDATACLGAGVDVAAFESAAPPGVISAINAAAAVSNASLAPTYAAILAAVGCPYPNSVLIDGECECVAERECLVGYNEALSNYVCVEWGIVIATLVVGSGGIIYAAEVESGAQKRKAESPPPVQQRPPHREEEEVAGDACPFCKDDAPLPSPVIFGPCGHAMCYACTEVYVSRFDTCPVCRGPKALAVDRSGWRNGPEHPIQQGALIGKLAQLQEMEATPAGGTDSDDESDEDVEVIESLHDAVISGVETDVLEYLVSSNNDDSDLPKFGGAPLIIHATKIGWVDVVRHLVETCDPKNGLRLCYGVLKETPLHIACKYNNKAVVNVLVEKGAVIDGNGAIRDIRGMTPGQYVLRR